MTATEIVDHIIKQPASASRLLPKHAREPGISFAYFEQIHRLFADDHAKLSKLRHATDLVVRYGDNLALGYRSLGIVERISGRWLQSAKAFQRAGETAQEPFERLGYQIGAIDGLARSGRIGQAVALGRSLEKGLRELGSPGMAARARLNLGYALMEQDRYEDAIIELTNLPEELHRSGYPVDSTSSRLALSTSLLFVGNPDAARRQAQVAADEALKGENLLLANIALGNIAYTDLLRGDVDVAVINLLKLKELHRDEPVELARILEFLGDAYLHMNLYREAVDSYVEAESLGVNVSALHRAHLKLGLGEAKLLAGNPAESVLRCQQAVEIYRKLGNAPWFAAASIQLACAKLALGLPTAKVGLRKALAAARASSYPLHLCKGLLVSAENGGPDEDLTAAAKSIRRFGLRQLTWRIYAERARRAEGKVKLASYRKMFKAILAEQSRTSSVSMRLWFLVDKQAAIQAYLEELLRKPTRPRIEEAISVVMQSRSVTLLDEIVIGRRAQLSVDVLNRLSKIREELSPGPLTSNGTGTRRHSSDRQNLDHFQRIWMEETFATSDFPATLKSIATPRDSLVYVSGNDSYRLLSRSRVQSLPTCEVDLRKRLRWLTYDIMAPSSDPNAMPEDALSQLRQLGEMVVRPALGNDGVLGICPEGALWGVPWLACLDAMGEDRDLELRLHPAFRGGQSARPTGRPMVWIAGHKDLPRAEEEAAAYLKVYPDAYIYRSAKDVRNALPNAHASTLHVISHARHRSNHPMFSSLDFTDGSILAAEIARSGLRVDLVTLSGCDTAKISDTNRLEPDGLVRAFLACGAGYVVGSAWPLDDEAAMRFYSSFFRSFASTANISKSLFDARKDVRKWNAHPYFWAFPLLYAGYRS